MSRAQKKVMKILDSPVGVIGLVIALFFLQVPYFFAVFPFVLALVFKARFAICLLLLLCLLILDGNLKTFFRKEILLWLCAAWSVVLCLSMYLNGKGGAELIDLIKDTVLISWMAILLIAVFIRVNLKKFLLVLFLYCLVINTLNNASVLFFFNTGIKIGTFVEPNREYVFFGHVNEGITCGINSILFGCLYSRLYGKSWDMVNVVNIIYSLITALAIDCVAQIITYVAGLAVLIVCYLYDRFPVIGKVFRWINLKTLMILNLLITLGVVFLGRTGWMELVGINPSIHGRRHLWDAAVDAFLERPILGRGYTSWISAEMSEGVYKTFWHQHSVYLQALYETGIVGFLILAAMFVLAIRASGRVKDFGIRFIIGCLVGVFFLAMTIEVCQRSELFLLLAVCFYIPEALQKGKQDVQTT